MKVHIKHFAAVKRCEQIKK